MRYSILLLFCLVCAKQRVSAQCQFFLIHLTRQSQIDSFSIQYPNCTNFEGSLFVKGKDISSLAGLSQLEVISGSLSINNTSVTDFYGLHNLESIRNLYVVFDSLITNFSGLEKLEIIDQDVIVLSNPLLTNFEGLGSLKRIWRGFKIESNLKLESLEGLSALEYVGESFELIANPSLTNFQGLNQLEKIVNDFVVENNGILNFNGLGSLRDVESLFWVKNNPNLISFDGLDSLDYAKHLFITNNGSLSDLQGLEHIREIDEDLGIANNPVLTSLSGLAISDVATTNSFFVGDNPMLSHCATPTVCEYLETRTPSIEDNAPGCTNRIEVESLCLVGVKDGSKLTPISIYPNPTRDILYLSETTNNIYAQILDMNGKEVLGRTKLDESLDVSFLPAGVYSIHLSGDIGYQIHKMVKY